MTWNARWKRWDKNKTGFWDFLALPFRDSTDISGLNIFLGRTLECLSFHRRAVGSLPKVECSGNRNGRSTERLQHKPGRIDENLTNDSWYSHSPKKLPIYAVIYSNGQDHVYAWHSHTPKSIPPFFLFSCTHIVFLWLSDSRSGCCWRSCYN